MPRGWAYGGGGRGSERPQGAPTLPQYIGLVRILASCYSCLGSLRRSGMSRRNCPVNPCTLRLSLICRAVHPQHGVRGGRMTPSSWMQSSIPQSQAWTVASQFWPATLARPCVAGSISASLAHPPLSLYQHKGRSHWAPLWPAGAVPRWLLTGKAKGPMVPPGVPTARSPSVLLPGPHRASVEAW